VAAGFKPALRIKSPVVKEAAMGDALYAPGERVVIDDPNNMNLLGLLMKGLLATNMDNARKYSSAKKIAADIQVQAGRMIITLRFNKGILTIIRGPSPNPNASVTGTMAALLGVVIGKGLVSNFLSGNIRIGGNPLMLLKVLPLISEPKGA
jgi:hypothetical protein